mmetsp:Transcript_29971/g.76868  ORF Transcript_29971/g.76868 Transcript_29971/m.76868 type:complete len:254 (-) Transcript_29971:110-871(-)|eukprot:jgi/Tetstr1/466070/TSEL_010657.t1
MANKANKESPAKPAAAPSSGCSQRCIWVGLLLIYLATLILSVGYGIMAIVVLDRLNQWRKSVSFTSVYNLSDDLIGVTGACVCLVICIAVYLIFSLVVLCGKLCAKKDHPDFRYGMLTGGTFFMIFICLQAAMTIHASHYWVEGPMQDLVRSDQRGSTTVNPTLFTGATVLGYVTSVLYFSMFIFLMMYQFSMACHCCSPPDTKESPPKAEAAAAAGASSPAGTSQPDEEKGESGPKDEGEKPTKGKVPSPWA